MSQKDEEKGAEIIFSEHLSGIMSRYLSLYSRVSTRTVMMTDARYKAFNTYAAPY